ncbi:hypothetical protein [Spirosoma pomorum]
MEDPKILFADTTERRAQLMAATERFKSSITDGVDTIKEDASEIGKTAAFVAGVSLAVYLVVNAVLPKSAEYRYAEKYGEPDEADYEYDEDDEDALRAASPAHKTVKRQAEKTQKSAAASGLIGGLVTSVLTNIAREQLTSFIARIRQNNAVNPVASPTEYHESAPAKPVDYTPGT